MNIDSVLVIIFISDKSIYIFRFEPYEASVTEYKRKQNEFIVVKVAFSQIKLLYNRQDITRFLYRLDRWFSSLNGFTLVILGALYSLLFGVSQGSVLVTVL